MPVQSKEQAIQEHPVGRLVANLTLLAQSFESVSEFCTKVGVNRQQFNKYLAARHQPSQKVLTQIARYFHMEPTDLLRSPEDFARFYDGYDQNLPDMRESPVFSGLLKSALDNGQVLARYHGFYQRYHCSALFKGQVLRSSLSIFERDGLTQYVTVERFPMSNATGGTSFFTFVFRGYCVLLGDRLFCIDFEDRLRNELTFTVLTPQHRTPARFLYGLLTGVASTSFRQPFSSRIALMRDGSPRLSRTELRRGGILDMASADIPAEIRTYLQSGDAQLMLGGEG
jgi:transcriptional regulator with XRE-family HTH domain